MLISQFLVFFPFSAPLSVLLVFFCSAAWSICGVRWRDFSRGFFWLGIFLFLFEFQLVFPPLQTEACAGDSYSTTMQLYRKEYIKGHISKSNFLWLLCSRLIFILTLQAQVSLGFHLNVSCDLCCWFKKGSYILKHLISHKGASQNADLFLQVAKVDLGFILFHHGHQLKLHYVVFGCKILVRRETSLLMSSQTK